MSKDRTTFTWQAADGYRGGERPQHAVIDNAEIQEAETLEEAVNFVEARIQNDFDEKVSPVWDDAELRAKVEEIWKKRERP